MLIPVLCPWYHPGGSVPIRVAGEKKKTLEIPSTRRSARIRLQIPVFVRGTDASGSEFIELTKNLNISALGACIACQHVLRSEERRVGKECRCWWWRV